MKASVTPAVGHDCQVSWSLTGAPIATSPSSTSTSVRRIAGSRGPLSTMTFGGGGVAMFFAT